MALKISEDSSLKKSATRKSRTRQSRGMMFLEAAMLLPMAAVLTVGAAYYANAYVTKTRLGDNARVIARAIQDDPGITQGGILGTPGELDQVISEATRVSDDLPTGFDLAKYKSCNPDIPSVWSDDRVRKHFARAGRYENRRGVFGNCGVQSDVGAQDARVSITSFATKPSASQIAALVPPNTGGSGGLHASGRAGTYAQYSGYRYHNPHSNPSKPYWVSVVAKKPMRQLSLFGWTFGSTLEIVNHTSVRVVPDPNSVTLFQHCDFDTTDGFAVTIKPGRYASMAELGFENNGLVMNNQLSRLNVSPGTQVTLYEGENFTGSSITITESTGCLTAPTQNFNDLTSSLVVERVPTSGSSGIGEPLFVKYTKPFDSSPGRTFEDWNNTIEWWNLNYSKVNHEKGGTPKAAIPNILQAVRNNCFSTNAALPPSHTRAGPDFEYCGRIACFVDSIQEGANGGKGFWPMMAQVKDMCPEGGNPGCNANKFYIAWACLNKPS